jgi:uncharacterized SAM-binding protein YcdF (DUF218 family)
VRHTPSCRYAANVRRVIESLLLPPASALLLLALGTLVRWRWRRCGRTLQVLAIVWLWAASTPAVGGALLHSLQTDPALPATGQLPAADAIVVLSAEADRRGLEYGGAVIGPMTMQRLRYGAHLHRRTKVPLLVSGGVPAPGAPSLAAMMATAADGELGVPVRWLEGDSADTRENARCSARLLARDGARRILLVTSAWHMPRAASCFRREGLEVIAAPTGFRGPAFDGWTSLLPSVGGLRDTCLALHEWGGRAYYAATAARGR